MRLKLFGRSGMKKIEADVAAARRRVEQLTAKRTAAQAELERAVHARQTYAIEGDIDSADADANMARLQAAVDSATSTTSGLDVAISEVKRQLTGAESELTTARDRAARTAVSEKIEKSLAQFEPRFAAWLEASRTLAYDLEKKFGTVRSHDAIALGAYLLHAGGEAELAEAVLVREIRAASIAIREGTEGLPADAPAPEPVVEVVPPPPMVKVWLLRHVRWTNPENGAIVIGPRFEDAEMPPPAAERALRCSAATRMDDPRRRQHKGTWGRQPSAEQCFDLDSADLDALPALDAVEPAPPPEEPAEPPNYEQPAVRHSRFEPLNRGPSFVIRAPRQVQS